MDTRLKKQDTDLFNYSYGRYLPNAILAFGVIGVGLSVKFGFNAFYLSTWWLVPSLILGVLSLLVFIPTEILQIDFVNFHYRVGVKVFAQIYGKWYPLGPVKYLSIVRVGKKITLSDNSIGLNFKDDVLEECQLRLFVKAGQHIIIDEYQSKASAIFIAKLIAEGLRLDILDATVRPAVFLDDVY